MSAGPFHRRAKRDEKPSVFRLIAALNTDDPDAPDGSESVHFVDDFETADGAEAYADRLHQAFPSIVGTTNSDVGRALCAAVGASFGIAPEAVSSKSRKRPFVHGRQAASYLGRTLRFGEGDGLTLVQVGMITARDHTTVMHAIKSASIRMKERQRFDDYERFARRLERAERTLSMAGYRFGRDDVIPKHLA
jgi:hypothetical protein